MKSYSQYQQDVYILNNYFPNKKDGVFVDIGAHDGVSLSNSLLFEEQGWDGVCIEPLPKVFEKLIKNRKCTCVNGAVSDKDGEYIEFCAIEGDCEMLSGILEKYDNAHKERILRESRGNNSTRQKLKIANLKFNDIIKFKHINLLGLDTEGGELDILKSIDYNKYVIDFILVENNYGTSDFYGFLKTKNFKFVTSLGCDQLYMNSNL
jgi:FkbM family methyltransferase